MRHDTEQLIEELAALGPLTLEYQSPSVTLSSTLYSQLSEPRIPANCFSGQWSRWDGHRLMLSNRLSYNLAQASYERLTSWNSFVTGIHPRVSEIATQLATKITDPKTNEITNSICQDLMDMCCEVEFADLVPPLFALPRVLPVYQAGRLPIDWEGPEIDTYWASSAKELPQGKIVCV
ncbi:MAG: hypothetical protein IPK22_03790 [Verrucomicrobiaceae bacterium]|nr:hypothetical protein [Verrucomicrobiaceae bacterium]